MFEDLVISPGLITQPLLVAIPKTQPCIKAEASKQISLLTNNKNYTHTN